jgi:hypothetical protein
VVKLNANGKQVWKTTAHVATSDSSRRTLARVLASMDGQSIFVVAGYVIVKLDGGGVQQWTRLVAPAVKPKAAPRVEAAPRVDAALRGSRLYYFLNSLSVVAVLGAKEGEMKSFRAYYDNSGVAAHPRIQLLPDGTILLMTSNDTFLGKESEQWSATSLARLDDVKAPPLRVAEAPPASAEAAAAPTAAAQPSAAPEGKPAAAPGKGAKQVRREKMKKFFQDLDKKTQKK